MIFLFFVLLIVMIAPFQAQSADKGIKFSGLAYIAYENEVVESPSINKFRINRAYFTAEKSIFDFLDFRMTIDVYDDDDGVETRMKYVYARFKLPDALVFNDLGIKFGMLQNPWLNFEQAVNIYRMQGTMFTERERIYASADVGANLYGNLGGSMEEEYRMEVNSKFAGKYGSFDFGLFNGSGYNRFELNDDKVLKGRLTLRPLPMLVSGMQFSIFGLTGKGNFNNEFKLSPDWKLAAGMLSFEHKYFTFTAQYIEGKGDFLGLMVNENGEAVDFIGSSLFGEIKCMDFRIFGRFDYFMPKDILEKFRENRLIVAFGYDFGNSNILLLDYDHTWKFSSEVKLLKLTLQVTY